MDEKVIDLVDTRDLLSNKQLFLQIWNIIKDNNQLKRLLYFKIKQAL